MNLIDQIGKKVTVWTLEGNSMEDRKLHTVDEFGIVVDIASVRHLTVVFVPWNRIKYIDYPNPKLVQPESNNHSDGMANQQLSGYPESR